MYFNKILIANRGEIAVRIMRACRELGITPVAIYSSADRSALHVRSADEAYLLDPEPTSGKSSPYLDVDRIIEIARQSGVEAIHPGYGFLSERAHFARACEAAGIVFIGPPADAIELMGSKIAAKRLAEKAHVPTAPGYMGDDQRPERLRDEAVRVGFPLLIKASAGGGGKGMRTVHDIGEFGAALEGAQREARAAFGDDAVFLERLIERPRHVEIQVLADAHGNCVHLFERECSIQRRHQKIVEESPSTALSPELRAEMGAAAVRLTQAAGYRNAGTMEFMLADDGSYSFLEMNTRLQVEHPITELVVGVDLVQLQIAVAAGEALPFTQNDLAQHGHAIEVRVYAEDPTTYLPSIGHVALFAPPEGPGIRNDVGIASGDDVTVHFDPMLAKLIVSAPERSATIGRLQRALDEYAVLGVTTNLPLLRAIAYNAAFAAGETRTDFLTVTGLASADFETHAAPLEVLAAAALFDEERLNGAKRSPDPWQIGAWRLLPNGRPIRYRLDGDEQTVYLSKTGETYDISLGGTTRAFWIAARRNNLLTLNIVNGNNGNVVEQFHVAADGDALLVAWRGASYRLERVRPLSVDTLGASATAAHGHASLEAPMPGTVIKVLAEEGAEVAAQQPLVVLEAMKMEHVVAAPYDGVVKKMLCSPGMLVTKGTTLVELEEHEGSGN